jgi:hypothetical protein
VFAALAYKSLQTKPTQLNFDGTDLRVRAKLEMLIEGYRKMLDLLFSKSKDLGDMLRFLPGIVVQKDMSMKGMPVTPMADLYRIEPDLLERLVKCTMASFKPSPSDTGWMTISPVS